MNEELEKLGNRLHLRKQAIIHSGLKKLPQDYIDLKQEFDNLSAQIAASKTKASTNLFAEAKAGGASMATAEVKIESSGASIATAEDKIKP